MILKEFPRITKEDDTLVDKTGGLDLISDFVEQMKKRGNDALVYYYNPEREQEIVNSEDSEGDNEVINGICWSPDFSSDDMINLLISYANLSFTPNQRKIFAKRLENAFLENEMYEEEQGFEESDYDD